MRGIKPNKELWAKVNLALLDASMADAIVTVVSGFSQMLIAAGAARDERQARVHLAAMILSPDDAPKAGSLLPELQAEIARLDDGKWLQ